MSYSIPRVSDALEELDFVAEAGAGPTDNGNIPCFQVYVEDLLYLDDAHADKLREVFSEVAFSSDEKYVISVSKEIFAEGTEDERYCFWIIGIKPYGEVSVGGIEYDIAGYDNVFLYGVEKGNANPLSGVAKINRDAVEWEP